MPNARHFSLLHRRFALSSSSSSRSATGLTSSTILVFGTLFCTLWLSLTILLCAIVRVVLYATNRIGRFSGASGSPRRVFLLRLLCLPDSLRISTSSISFLRLLYGYKAWGCYEQHEEHQRFSKSSEWNGSWGHSEAGTDSD